MDVLTIPEVADLLAVPVTRVHQFLRDGSLVGVRNADGVRCVPADFVQDAEIVKGLPAVITQLRDARYGDDEIVEWLFREDAVTAGHAGPGAAREPGPRGQAPRPGRRFLTGATSALPRAAGRLPDRDRPPRGGASRRGLPRNGGGCCAAVVPVAVVFAAWDAWAVASGAWRFAPADVLGFTTVAGLPLEEVLFFLVVPLCSILTLEAVRTVRPQWSIGDEGRSPGELHRGRRRSPSSWRWGTTWASPARRSSAAGRSGRRTPSCWASSCWSTAC